MYASASVALHKEKEAEASFAMERLVARIDITNKAYGMGTNSFVLTGARILQAKPASYLVPHDLYASPEVLTVSGWTLDNASIKLYKGDVSVANETTEGAGNATQQAAWHALYTYENDDVSHAPTGLEVTGTMNGATITRKIPFEVTDADGTTKKPVPIVRNHRYLVQISPAPGQTDITYQLTVDEWNAVDTVNVQPNQNQVPVVTDIIPVSATKVYGNATSKLDTIVVPAAGGSFKFKADCPFDSRVSFGYVAGDEQDWLSATSSDAELVPATKGATAPTYRREYTVTVKQTSTLDGSLVNRGYLYLANGANGSVMDTITVYQGADIAYGETRFAAVTMGQVNGKDVVWAPMNVGATEIATEIIQDESTPEIKAANVRQCGDFYQWGRNVPLKYGGESSDLVQNITLVPYAEATKPNYQYADKFITTNGYWFSDYSTFSKDWPKENDPCPVGWRVPTKEELEILQTQITPAGYANGVWISPTNPAFVLPFPGWRDYRTGTSAGRSTNGPYWSSTCVNGRAWRLDIKSGTPSLGDREVSAGYSVRCVKE